MRDILLTLFCFSYCILVGQNNYIYPEYFQPEVLNIPEESFLHGDDQLQANLYHRRQIGLFENIQQTKGLFNYNTERSSYAFQIQSENEGDFISKSWIHFRYSIKTQLSNKASLGVYFLPGIINYKIGDEKIKSGSDMSPDINTGIFLGYENTFALAGLHQAGNFSITPLDTEHILKRYYRLLIKQTIPIKEIYGIELYGQGMLYSDQKDLYQLGLSFYRKDILKIMLIGNSYGDMVYTTEVDIPKTKAYHWKAYVAYEVKNQLKNTGMQLSFFHVGVVLRKTGTARANK